MAEIHEDLRERIAMALHEVPDLLAGEVLIFEDCLTLADAVIALGEVSEDFAHTTASGRTLPIDREEALALDPTAKVTRFALLAVPLPAVEVNHG
jgi:hypothetical protein